MERACAQNVTHASCILISDMRSWWLDKSISDWWFNKEVSERLIPGHDIRVFTPQLKFCVGLSRYTRNSEITDRWFFYGEGCVWLRVRPGLWAWILNQAESNSFRNSRNKIFRRGQFDNQGKKVQCALVNDESMMFHSLNLVQFIRRPGSMMLKGNWGTQTIW